MNRHNDNKSTEVNKITFPVETYEEFDCIKTKIIKLIKERYCLNEENIKIENDYIRWNIKKDDIYIYYVDTYYQKSIVLIDESKVYLMELGEIMMGLIYEDWNVKTKKIG